MRRTFWLDTRDADPIGLDTDDIITLRTSAGTVTGTASSVARSELPGLPATVETTRIDLKDE
jgi:hypothetical protein